MGVSATFSKIIQTAPKARSKLGNIVSSIAEKMKSVEPSAPPADGEQPSAPPADGVQPSAPPADGV